MMGVFGTTGEALINEGEILEAFNRMDTNKDDVISKYEFSEAPEVSKLPQESQEELFDTIDLNEDGVIQFDEFRIQAQVTESEVLAINKEQVYMEAYKVAMEDFIITDDERKMLNHPGQNVGHTRAAWLSWSETTTPPLIRPNEHDALSPIGCILHDAQNDSTLWCAYSDTR